MAAAAARTHAVLLREDGTAVAWGHNGAGECAVPLLPEGTRYVDCAAGGSHTLLVRSDGAAVAFGHNGAQQCDLPAVVEARYVACAAAWTHSVLLRDDGQAVAVGGNGRGQCVVPPLGEGLAYVAVVAGGAHTLRPEDIFQSLDRRRV